MVKKTLKIGICLYSRNHAFHQGIEKGLIEEAKKNGDELIIYSADNDKDKQAKQIKEHISKKLDVIAICPVDSMAIGESIVEANNAGIPVFMVDTTNMSGKGRVVSYVTSDNLHGGRLGARLLARAVKYNGNVVVLTHPTIESCLEREEGFKETLKTTYPDIKIVYEIPVLGKRDKAAEAVERVLKEKKKIDGIFAVSDESALGALKALESTKKVGEIKIVGYDAIPEARIAIAEGKIYADIRQFPIKIGHETIKTINEYFEELKIPPVVYIEVGTWT